LAEVEKMKFPTSEQGQAFKFALGSALLYGSKPISRVREKAFAMACSYLMAYRLIDIYRRLNHVGNMAETKSNFAVFDNNMVN
jgi:hypothetical protein